MNADRFIDVELSRGSMESFVLRRGIYASLKRNLGEFRGRVLDIGCGCMPYREIVAGCAAVNGYVGLDLEDALVYDRDVVPDCRWDGHSMPFRDGEFDTAMATEVLEHCPDPGLLVREASRVLCTGGVFLLTVPFVYRVHEAPYDFQRFTPYGLEHVLLGNGFSSCTVEAYGGFHASMAHMLGLWVTGVRIADWKRRLLACCAIPAMKYLLAKDRGCDPFADGAMFPGLCAVVRK